RLDFSERQTMVGRAHIVFSHQPRVVASIGALKCVVTPADDRWYDVTAMLPAPQPISALSFFLMREGDAVIYSGAGKWGVGVAGVALGLCGERHLRFISYAYNLARAFAKHRGNATVRRPPRGVLEGDQRHYRDGDRPGGPDPSRAGLRRS